jgi:hypothetical protein
MEGLFASGVIITANGKKGKKKNGWRLAEAKLVELAASLDRRMLDKRRHAFDFRLVGGLL